LVIDKDGNGTYETISWDMYSDLNKDRKADWMEVVDAFKDIGWEWGGDWKFKDYPHLEKRPKGITWRTLYSRYLKNEFLPGTKYVSIL
jgi:peptidoglycan L-alanyl-D-glutamate endopeptidase CwlK